jgi:uncharacterized protein (TIGR00369 family)
VVLQTENASRQIVRRTSQTTLRNRVAKRAQRCDCHGVSDQLGAKFMTQASAGKRFGVVSDDQQRAMSGLEFVQGLINATLPLNTMAQTLGYDIVEVSKGRVVAAAEPHAGHLNPAGTVHGGFAATLLDSCMGLAVRSMLDKGFAQTTLEFKISLVRPITPQTGVVKAEGKIISCGRRVGTAEGQLTDKDGRVLAHGTTTCLIFEG